MEFYKRGKFHAINEEGEKEYEDETKSGSVRMAIDDLIGELEEEYGV